MISAVLIIIFAILVVLIIFYIRRGNKWHIKRLRRKFMALSRMSPADAKESLDWQIDKLKRKFPDKSMAWYLEKVLYDLERDRGL